jgi:hypothetical protein
MPLDVTDYTTCAFRTPPGMGLKYSILHGIIPVRIFSY